jgi:protein-disulfide isomerase
MFINAAGTPQVLPVPVIHINNSNSLPRASHPARTVTDLIMKYLEIVYKTGLIVLLSVILFFTVKLVRYVDKIGSLVYSYAKPAGQPLDAAKISKGNLYSGTDTSRLKMTVFIDLECSYCKQFFNVVIPSIEDKYVKTGKISIYTKHLPLTHLHPTSELYAKGAEYAKILGIYRQYINKVYSTEADFSKRAFNKLLYSLSIDTIAFNDSLTTNKYISIQKDIIEANGYNIRGTPTVVINNNVTLGYQDFDYFRNIIENELKLNSGTSCN